MATNTLKLWNRISGSLTNATSVALSNQAGTIGIKRNDTDAVVIADGTAMTNSSTGLYEYTFTVPTMDIAYTAYFEVTQTSGDVDRTSHVFTPQTETNLDEVTLLGDLSTTATALTEAEILAIIAKIDGTIIGAMNSQGYVNYRVGDRAVDRADALKMLMELRAFYLEMISTLSAIEMTVYDDPHV